MVGEDGDLNDVCVDWLAEWVINGLAGDRREEEACVQSPDRVTCQTKGWGTKYQAYIIGGLPSGGSSSVSAGSVPTSKVIQPSGLSKLMIWMDWRSFAPFSSVRCHKRDSKGCLTCPCAYFDSGGCVRVVFVEGEEEREFL